MSLAIFDRERTGSPPGRFVLLLLGLLSAACIFCAFLGGCVAAPASGNSNAASEHAAEEPALSNDALSPGEDASDNATLSLGEDAQGEGASLQSDDSSATSGLSGETNAAPQASRGNAVLESVPPFDQSPSVAVEGDIPDFEGSEVSPGSAEAFEQYSDLDSLGRCGQAIALVGPETMPTEERGSIGEIRPSGWKIAKYDWIDGQYLYNRCHLIGYQLTGQNANELNLITGTRYLNVEGMEPLENEVASYVRASGNHVLYRVTPVFDGDNLVASGVLMEARSIEDDGAGVCFCRWCYNVEPGVTIDYATGFSHIDGEGQEEPDQPDVKYILNTRSHRIHLPACPAVDEMSEHNKREYNGTLEEAETMGYRPCGVCNPQ